MADCYNHLWGGGEEGVGRPPVEKKILKILGESYSKD